MTGSPHDLRIATRFKLPIDVAGEAIAILAKRGAGKTNTATVLAEEMHAAGVQLVILDPVGAWWGLRHAADGKGEGLPIPILGGQHGDVPLEQTAGALIADVVVDSSESLLLDLSDFPSKAAIARFVTDFTERLYRRKARTPSLLHVFLEEADSFAPQRGGADDARMRGAIEQIVRRGRSRGLGITMVTQRSAVLNKDVLSQADVMLAMRTTSPHDVAAIKLWISAHGDEGEDEVVPSLPSLKTGEAWVWNPERAILHRVHVRRRQTFDSSATPKAGERRVEPRKAASIDLATLGEQIQATAERVKAQDPRELQKRVRELEKQLRERPAETKTETVVETLEIEVPVLKPGNTLETVLLPLLKQLPEALERTVLELEKILKAVDGDGAARAGRTERGSASAPRAVSRPPARRPAPAAPQPAEVDSDFKPSRPQQKILDALAWFEAIGVEPRRPPLAAVAGASSKSSGFEKNVSTLRTAGLIDYPSGGRVALTDAGRALAEPPEAMPTNDALHEAVFGMVSGPQATLLRVLISAYPDSLTREELADQAEVSMLSSGFEKNVSTLKSFELIEYPGRGYVAAAPLLFPEDAYAAA